MRLHLLSFLLISILITACADNRVRKNPPVPSSPDELVTGCYYIVEDSTAFERTMTREDGAETFFLDPKPIFTVGDFEKIKLIEEDYGPSLRIELNDKGSEAFATATKKYIGKRLAFIIYNELVMAPVVQGEITAGSLEISGNLSKRELNRFLKMIDAEMYVQ